MENLDLAKIINRIEKLERAVFGEKKQKSEPTKKQTEQKLTFDLNERAFVKRYTVGKSGPKKFTLLLAYLSKGEISKNIDLSDLKKCWGKMSSKNLLGQFNMFYPNDAKTRGWVDSKEYGVYNLTNEWKDVLL
ncbi:MAG: hypothetical protein WCX77_04215 [Candidatus Paceibacterota bacterium]|jgi:hypothetical protein